MMRLVLSILLVFAVLGPAGANPVQREHTRVALIAQSMTPEPGARVRLALVMTPNPGWHTYWRNWGDSGMETLLDWSLPKGASIGEPAYPAPGKIPFGPLMNYGYKSENALLLDLDLPDGLAPGTSVPIGLKASWLVCDDEICVPEEAALSLTLAIGDGAADRARQADFVRWEAALPKPSPWPAKVRLGDGRFVLVAELGRDAAAVSDAYFYPLDDAVLTYAAPQRLSIDGGRLRLDTLAAENPGLKTVRGVLELSDVSGLQSALAIEAPVDAAIPLEAPAAAAAHPSLPPALVLALLGGVLLNLMPCVFPILSLKALSLSQAGADEQTARRHALAYTFGVVAMFAVVGGVLLALRAGGNAVGWGFQLQEPMVVTALALLMVAVALNLFGMFEVGGKLTGAGNALARQGGAAGSFWTGALAVLVATPCTAPFMAAALGAALVLPPVSALAVFLALGLGMALPFLALGLVPALRRRMPRPGAWMSTFKTLLGFPMLATALWLFWVAGQQAGVTAMSFAMAAALLLALGLWLFGRRQRAPAAPMWQALIAVVAILSGSALALAAMREEAHAPASASLAGEAYSDARLDELLAMRKPVFVYFTADWCITCKVNERGALQAASVTRAFTQAGVTTLVGDWTRRDDVIARTLERYGRSGVPLYLYFRPGAGAAEPLILPQVLTPATLIQTVLGPQSGA